MLKWPLAILSKIGSITLIGYIAWMGWDNLGPIKPEIGPARKALADKIVHEIVEDIRISKGDFRDVVLLHFSNDLTDYFTEKLREVIWQSGVLELRDTNIAYKARNLLRLRHPAYYTADEAIAKGRKFGSHCILYGVIHAFESFPGGAKIDVEVHLIDASNGQPLFTNRYGIESPHTTAISASVKETSQSFPWFQRLFGWLITVLLLPVFTLAFIRTMVSKGSNKTNAFVLSIYTAVDALLAWLLVGAALRSWFTILVFIVAVLAAFLYNVWIMTYALRLEET